ncbi:MULTISPECIES: thioesterase II family protein [Streptomyces]|uniref:thioesterase II family protein n=1 Tax=Streptomyces TaxID=1883 RepID=UPI00093C68E4|nr:MULTISPECIES: alpha/beta fold hydrolase [Streptomyces]MCX4502496.1 alpha/beta fold hydrolase [Streptomyces anulatus]OKI54998.1 oleoyl-ACP hydrolase [Streptomyces sp. CB00072]WTE30813.1 alpha/beta fold hydrolase [Streptomyces anulatus]
MAGPRSASAWIRSFHPSPQATTRIVCLPYAGGSAAYHFPLSRALSGVAKVLAVQYPGRQDRFDEAHIEDMASLADRITDALTPWTDRPLILFGHSLGAAVAFEVALRLERQGVRPLGLVASGRRAPSIAGDQRLHTSSDEEVVDELIGLNSAHAELLGDRALWPLLLPTVRSDYKVSELYRSRDDARLACPITALTGEDDPVVDVADVRDWDRHTSGDFTMRVFSGGHFFLDDHAEAVQAEITRYMAYAV